MSNFAIIVDGLETVRDVRGLDDRIRTAAYRAINKVARDTRSRAARLIQDQINIPARYVAPSKGRLSVSRKANRNSLESRITARGRAMSLANFVTGSSPGKSVTVEVKPGQATHMRRAFLIRLPQGNSAVTDTRFNHGLAIRLKAGETISNKVRQVRLAKGLYLLYGPSVQQLFLNNAGKGIADDISGDTAAKLEAEFLRLLKL